MNNRSGLLGFMMETQFLPMLVQRNLDPLNLTPWSSPLRLLPWRPPRHACHHHHPLQIQNAHLKDSSQRLPHWTILIIVLSLVVQYCLVDNFPFNIITTYKCMLTMTKYQIREEGILIISSARFMTPRFLKSFNKSQVESGSALPFQSSSRRI